MMGSGLLRGAKMIDDDDMEYELLPPDMDFDDPVAARAVSHVQCLHAAAKFKGDKLDELYDEALNMAKAIRRSFKTLPAGELSAIKGGKEDAAIQ
jgi:hypothetical protein